MLNEAAVVHPSIVAQTVSEEARMLALGALERESAPRRAVAEVGRVDALAERIALHVESIVPRGRAHCLEIGRRGQAPVQAIKSAVARISWQSIDIERAPASDGAAMPYDDAQFDVAVLWNVLHDAPAQAARLLTEAARVASHVLVSDRFDQPSYARAMPWLANLIRHDARCDLTRDAFVRFVTEQGLVITALDCDLESAQGRDRSFLALLRRP